MRTHTLAVASLFVIHGLAFAGVTVTGPGAGQITKTTCPSADGSNSLNPCPPTLLPPPAAGSDVMNELGSGDTSFSGWTFTTGASLSGTIKITTYNSRFVGAHKSGCVMKLEYVKGAGDPANLQFIQLITTDAPAPGATSPYIDPYPSDDPTAGGAMPFYFTAAEMPHFTTSTGIKFEDSPLRTHNPTSSVKWRGKLYITSWDGAKKVTMHDGIEYGFDAGCTKPVPAVTVTSTTLSNTVVGDVNDVVYVTPSILTVCTADLLPIILIPNDPALIGFQFYSQVVVFDDDVNDPIKVSNALNLTINGPVSAFGAGSGFSLFAYVDPTIGGMVDLRLIADSHPHEAQPGDTDGKEPHEL